MQCSVKVELVALSERTAKGEREVWRVLVLLCLLSKRIEKGGVMVDE